MKLFHRLKSTLSMATRAAWLGVGLLAVQTASANPFASCITVNNGNVQFYINESGANVTVTYEDGSTNVNFNGITTGTNVASGPYTFSLSNNSINHTGYAITCQKLGLGSPVQISSDTGPYNTFGSPRGVDVNKNPQYGAYFGRIYVGESTASGNKARGIYPLTPDMSANVLGQGFNPSAGGVFTTASSSSPYHVTVGPDNNVYVADYSTANATVFAFDPSFSQFTNVILNPIGEVQGFNAGVHGDPTDVAITGSLAQSNLVVYTFDPDLPLSYTAALYELQIIGTTTNPVYHIGSEGYSTPGQFNNIYKYNIGAGLPGVGPFGSGPAPWTNGPNMGVCLGLPTFQDSQIGNVAVEPNGYVAALFERGNYSDGDIQIYDTNFNLIYTSLQPNGTDPFDVPTAQGGGLQSYAGVRISADGRYLMTVTVDNQINICFLTNGCPDVSSMIKIGAATTGNSRGCAFDAADNIYYVSSGLGLLRCFSLGYSSSCVTSNDITGTNGTFSFTVPSVSAALAITQATASQNYGSPTPASFSINLNTNVLSKTVTINYSLGGTATNAANYTVNVGTDPHGVVIATNSTGGSVTFPAGTYPSGNWTVSVVVTPTASPVSGPTLTVNVAVAGGTTYVPAEPVTGSLVIMNTGPQELLLSAATYGTNMSRAVPNDYAEFIITRYGDQSVGGYTVTNFTFSGTAAFPADYTAGAQNMNPPPVDGLPSIVVNTGASAFTNIIGNPVARANLYAPPTNVTITISLVNAVTGTNNTSQEGVAYTVYTNTVTLVELDNAAGGEVVEWSNPLTNSMDSTNWTVTFGTSLLATNTVLPVLINNYTNNESTVYATPQGSNDFLVLFGNPVASDGISPSPVMAANGWTTALKTSLENNYSAVSGVNIFPQGMKFQGNYALRFSMYLALYDRAAQNPYYSGVADRQYATFGIDTKGTNCDWRPTAAVVAGSGQGQGSGVINWDGIWFAIDAGMDAQTPADYDAFASPALPNSGGSDLVSNRGEDESGIFKDPPFGGVLSLLGTYGGEPVNQWVDVSVETTLQTNISLYMNHSQVLSSFANTNAGPIVIGGVPVCGYTNGDIMLGYEDPLVNLSDGSAFAYYSNVRVVELSPYLTGQPANLIATNGQTVTFSAPANFASAPLTNTWYLASTNAPIGSVFTNVVNATNMIGTLTLPNIQVGTNYLAVFSDVAGSITGAVANVEVIQSPVSISTHSGDTVSFSVFASGSSAPTSYQWKLNGTNLTSNTHFAGATGAALTITNAQISDAGTYSVAVVNAAGTVTPTAVLSVILPPTPAFSSVSRSGANVLMSFTTLDTSVTTSSFVLLSSPTVNGPYTTNASAVITGGNGSFQITVPSTTNSTMFYQIYDY